MSKKIKGKTQSGFAYEIEEARLNNYELLETIGELEDNPMVISKMVVIVKMAMMAVVIKMMQFAVRINSTTKMFKANWSMQ